MENKLKQIKLFFPLILILVILIISVIKITKNREEKLYKVMYNKIEIAATECYQKGDCVDNITLNDLYEKDYLEEQYDPITKELLDKNKKITYKDNEVIIEK